MSWLLFGLIGIILHQEHKQDRYQNHIIYLGLICCCFDAFLLKTGDPLKTMGRYLPIYICFTMALSALVHRWVIPRDVEFSSLPAYQIRDKKPMDIENDNSLADQEMGTDTKESAAT